MTPSTHLSPTLSRLAEVIGLAAALKLCEAFGGTEIYVPMRVGPDHPVARCVGAEAARGIARAFGAGRSGARIDVPKADDLSRAGRNRAIATAAAAGASKQALARLHGLTTRWVRAICNGDGADDRQLGLFDPPER